MRYYALPFVATLLLSCGFLYTVTTRAEAQAAAEVVAQVDAGVPDAVVAADHAAPATGPIVGPDPIAEPSAFLSWVKDRRKDGSLWSWLIVVAFAVLAAVWKRLQPNADAPEPSKWRRRSVAAVACALGLVALAADIAVGAGHFALVATSVGPVVLALVMNPFVSKGSKAAPKAVA
jgi:hypothetical protein